MMQVKLRVLFFSILLFLLTNLIAQSQSEGAGSFSESRHRIGFVSGYGDQDLKYDYRITFFQVQYYFGLLQWESWGLDLLVQPQYNTIRYRALDTDSILVNGHEYGVNAGVVLRKNFQEEKLSLFALGTSGPHYVDGTPKRQADGFLFNSSFYLGMNVRLYKNLYLDIRTGIRHISNAGLKSPNGGVNNFIISGGFLINL